MTNGFLPPNDSADKDVQHREGTDADVLYIELFAILARYREADAAAQRVREPVLQLLNEMKYG